jgi:Mrp family chromosome partitioning ATPase
MTLDDGFRTLRLTCEASAPAPAVVIVASVTSADGAIRVARGLAEALVEAGSRVLLVAEDALPRRIDGVDVMALAELGAPRRALADLRELYDATVIVPPPLGTSSRGLDLARQASGVVLAVRLGRAITAEDERLAGDLRRVGAAVIGVVTTRGGAGEAGSERAGATAPQRASHGANASLSKGTSAWRSS